MSPRDVVDAVKRLSPPPATLRVELVDGDPRSVAMPKAGNKWSKLATVIGALPSWVRIDALDGDGGIVGSILDEDDDDADGEDDYADDAQQERSIRLFARLLAEGQRSTMREVAKMFESASKSQAAALESVVTAMTASTEIYQQALRAQAAHAATAGGGEGESDEFNAMMKLGMMHMLQSQGRPPLAAAAQARPVPPTVPPQKGKGT
jgi:hypothetical protein